MVIEEIIYRHSITSPEKTAVISGEVTVSCGTISSIRLPISFLREWERVTGSLFLQVKI